MTRFELFLCLIYEPLCRFTSDLIERSQQLQSAKTDATQVFEQSQLQRADLLRQLQAAQLATQQACDAQLDTEQKLHHRQQVSDKQLREVTAEMCQQAQAAKHSQDALSLLQEEFQQRLAAALSEADQKLSSTTAGLSQQLRAAQAHAQHQQQQLQDLQCHADSQLQVATTALEQRLQVEHGGSMQQLQQQLQTCQHDYQSMRTQNIALEQQVQSAKAAKVADLQELRDKFKSAHDANLRQHFGMLEDTKRAHKKAADRHAIEVAELQAALEREQDRSVQREHQALQEYLAGMAAKDTMVQQMWGQLHDKKQDCERYLMTPSKPLQGSVDFDISAGKFCHCGWCAICNDHTGQGWYR